MNNSIRCINHIRKDYHLWLQSFVSINPLGTVIQKKSASNPDDHPETLGTSQLRSYRNWSNGKNKITESSAKEIGLLIPDVWISYNHPLFKLLNPKPISPKNIFQSLQALLISTPRLQNKKYSEPYFKPYESIKSECFESKHLYCFMKELLVLRLSEIGKYTGEHPYLLIRIYSRLPYIASMSIFYPYRKLLYRSIIDLHELNMFSRSVVEPNWKVITRTTKIENKKPSIYALNRLLGDTTNWRGNNPLNKKASDFLKRLFS